MSERRGGLVACSHTGRGAPGPLPDAERPPRSAPPRWSSSSRFRGGGVARAGAATRAWARPSQAILQRGRPARPDAHGLHAARLRRREHQRSSTTPAGLAATSPSPARNTRFNGTVTHRAARRRALGAEEPGRATRCEIAKISAEETRRQVALARPPRPTWPSSPPSATREIAVRNLATRPAALADYARARLTRARAAGSTTSARPRSWRQRRRSDPRWRSRRCSRPRKPLGIATFSEGPWRRAAIRSTTPAGRRPTSDAWLIQRAGRAPVHGPAPGRGPRGARRTGSRGCRSDTAYFTPQYVTPEPASSRRAKTWQAFFSAPDPGLRQHASAPTKRVQLADRATAQIRLDERCAWRRGPRSASPRRRSRATCRSSSSRAARPPRTRSRRSASPRSPTSAGATTNIEVVQAQRDGAPGRDRGEGIRRGPPAAAAARPAGQRLGQSSAEPGDARASLPGCPQRRPRVLQPTSACRAPLRPAAASRPTWPRIEAPPSTRGLLGRACSARGGLRAPERSRSRSPPAEAVRLRVRLARALTARPRGSTAAFAGRRAPRHPPRRVAFGERSLGRPGRRARCRPTASLCSRWSRRGLLVVKHRVREDSAKPRNRRQSVFHGEEVKIIPQPEPGRRHRASRRCWYGCCGPREIAAVAGWRRAVAAGRRWSMRATQAARAATCSWRRAGNDPGASISVDQAGAADLPFTELEEPSRAETASPRIRTRRARPSSTRSRRVMTAVDGATLITTASSCWRSASKIAPVPTAGCASSACA